jgi:hypothetical protein
MARANLIAIYRSWTGYLRAQGKRATAYCTAGHLVRRGRDLGHSRSVFWDQRSLIVAATERMKLDIAHSWIAGDPAADHAAGKAAGLAGSRRADGAERVAAVQLHSEEFAVNVASSLADVVSLLLARGWLTLRTSAP